MSRTQVIGVWSSAAVIMLFTVASPVCPASSDTVLKWDDGEAAPHWDSIQGMWSWTAAVEFTAPGWAQSISEIDIYVTRHAGDWPYGPPDTTYAFAVCVWEPLFGIYHRPGDLILAYNCGSGHPVDQWAQIDLPYLVSLSDLAGFPSRRFFAGVLWLHGMSPSVGIDDTAPAEDVTWIWDRDSQVNLEGANAMVRAVVTDATDTAVEPRTWSRIKAMFAEGVGRVPN